MSLRKRLVAALALAAFSRTAEAQVARVFVSVNGNDANVCSNIATPCRTFGGGIAQVDAQGEVIVIDSGSYAGGAITKSVRIDVAPGVVAFSGVPITVDPGAGGVVVLRGLTLKAATPGSGNGIAHSSGTLFVENAVVDGWSYGLYVTGAGPERLLVKGSVFRNNTAYGLVIGAFATVKYAIDGSFFEKNNSAGLSLYGGKGRISNSSMTANGTGAFVINGGVVASFQRCEFSENITGVLANGSAVARVAGSTIADNGIGLSNVSATLESFGNNVVRGNTTDTSGTITPVGLQ
jgi:hypothetical protein